MINITTQDEWKNFFPKPIPRPQQVDAINEIITFFESNLFEQQIFLLNAPTGIGKSAIGITVANYFFDKYGFGTNYLVNDKYLEKQILGDFPDVKATYGRNMFTCLRNQKPCDIGECQKKSSVDRGEQQEKKCEYSPYRVQQSKSSDDDEDDNSETIENTPIQLLEFKFPKEALISYFKDFIPKIGFKKGTHCSYWDCKVNATKSPIALHNYAYYQLEGKFIGDFSKRWLVICDEGHKVEDMIMNFVSFSFTKRGFEELGIPIQFKRYSIEDWMQKVKQAIVYLKTDFDKFVGNQLQDSYMSDIASVSNKMGKYMTKDKDKLESKAYNLLLRLQNVDYIDPKDWVIEYESEKGRVNEDDIVGVSFKPIEIKKFTFQTLLRNGVKFLLMSGTLLSEKKIIDTLGLEDLVFDERVKYMDMNSPFLIENRMFYYIPVASMNYANTDESVEKMLPILKTILEKYPNEKGIIHTKSYKLATLLYEKLNDKRILIHDTKSRNQVLELFLNDKTHHYVLTSPSIEEGVDLYDDRCRFIIILKVPYLSLGNEQIKKRLDKDQEWYSWKCIQTIIQMAGRGVRHQDDYCTTYMLDGNFSRLLNQYNEFFPQWFREGIKEVDPTEFLVENS